MQRPFRGKILKKSCLRTYKIKILARARKEILEARNLYEARRKGFGKLFSLELQSEIERIGTNPFLFKKNEFGFSEIPMKRFPHLIIYSCIEDSIVIASIFHTSQNPKKKPR